MVVSPATHGLALVGGAECGSGDRPRGRLPVWSFSGGSWTVRAAAKHELPPTLQSSAVVYDPHLGAPLELGYARGADSLTTLRLTASGTRTLPALGDVPTRPTRTSADLEDVAVSFAAYDAGSGVVLLQSGPDDQNGLWLYDGKRWRHPALPVALASGVPIVGATFDPALRGVVVMGLVATKSFDGEPAVQAFRTWLFDGRTWRVLERDAPGVVAPTPDFPPATTYQAVFDSRLGGVLLVAGSSDAGAPAKGSLRTWLFKGRRWHQIPTRHAPPDRFGQAVAYDPDSGDTILYGGVRSSTGANLGVFSDTWRFDGHDWTLWSGQAEARDYPLTSC